MSRTAPPPSPARGPTVGRVLALTAVTALLAAAVGITGERRARTARPLLVAGLRFDDLRGVELARDAAATTVALDGGPARIVAPAAAAADERAVRDLISAIATARFDRVAGAGAGAWRRAGLDAPVAVVRLQRRAGADVELRVGATLPASGQTWLAVDRRVGLAPSWVADAIVRDPDSLRQRRPFPGAAAITAVELHAPGVDLVLAGAPLTRRDAGTRVALDPARRDALIERVAALTVPVAVAADPDAADDPAAALTVRVQGGATAVTLRAAGPCPGHSGLRLVATDAGAGCVDAAALDDLIARAAELATAAAIAAAPVERFDRATVAALDLGGAPPLRLEPDGAGWRLARADRTWPVDATLIRDAVAALTSPATVSSAPTTTSTATVRWQLRRPSGDVETWTVDLGPPRGPARVTLRREQEPVTLTLDPAASAAVRAIGPGLRDRALVTIDPVALAAVEVTGVAPATLTRGALIDEWHVTAPAGAAVAPGFADVRARLATLRAAAWSDAADLGPVRRTLRLTLDPGPGAAAPRTVVLALGAAGATGCAARVDDGDVARLALADCAALLAPLVTAPR